MPDRKTKRPSCTIDVVLLTAVGSQLAVLLCRAPEGREKWVLPWDAQRPQEAMEASALRIAKGASVGEPAWLESVVVRMFPRVSYVAATTRPLGCVILVTNAGHRRSPRTRVVR